MRVHTLRREQRLPAPPEEVVPYFAEALNLEEITPTWLAFSVVTAVPIAAREGAVID